MKRTVSFVLLSVLIVVGAVAQSKGAKPSQKHEYVDLGLSVKWATCNIGANSPEEYGDYFCWGETKPKESYLSRNYKLRTDNGSLSKYTWGDKKVKLALSDDAARANWGAPWRMPTKEELLELQENCTWTWTTQNGVNGHVVTSKKNGRSIFLPAAGYRSPRWDDPIGKQGYYCANEIDKYNVGFAYVLLFYSEGVGGSGRISDRDYGYPVRPVRP